MTAHSRDLTIVLVHGAWADGSCWRRVVVQLQRLDFKVTCAPLPLTSLVDDVSALARTLERTTTPVVLAGHAYAGAVIGATRDDQVKSLVYIAALAPDGNETSQSLQNQFPKTDVFSHIEAADGRIWLRADGVGCFAGDLSAEEQKVVWATQMAPVADLFDQKVEGTAWKSQPSWYIVATKDRTVHPELERFVAKRMGATTYEVDSSHVPMLSQPNSVLDVIRTAAEAVQKNAAREPVGARR